MVFFSWLNWDHISNYRFLSEFLKTKFQTKKKRENELLNSPATTEHPALSARFHIHFTFHWQNYVVDQLLSLAMVIPNDFIPDLYVYIYIKCTENPELLYRWSCFFSASTGNHHVMLETSWFEKIPNQPACWAEMEVTSLGHNLGISETNSGKICEKPHRRLGGFKHKPWMKHMQTSNFFSLHLPFRVETGWNSGFFARFRPNWIIFPRVSGSKSSRCLRNHHRNVTSTTWESVKV